MNKKQLSLRLVSIFIATLILSLPVCFASELNLVYDANGNLVSGDGLYREYNSLNQLSKVYNESAEGTLLEEFTYHPLEERILVKKDYITDTTTYYFSESFVQVVNSSGTFNYTYVYHNGQLVGQDLNGEKLFIHGDHLGSSSIVTNINGTILENTTYSPFGEVLSGGEEVRFGYEGKEHDSLVGDTDFHFRKYKPEWAMFTQPDTLIQNVYDPQSLNRYSFERNNPYKYVDKNGHVISEPLSIIRYILNPSSNNFRGMVNSLVIDNVITLGLGLATSGAGAVWYELTSDLWVGAGLLTDGFHEFVYNEEEGMFDDSYALTFVDAMGDLINTMSKIPCIDVSQPINLDNQANPAGSTVIVDPSDSGTFVPATSRKKVYSTTYNQGGKSIKVNLYQPARDAEGKTRIDRIIERIKKRNNKS